ncbi:sulfatase-like hydrolase/transferase [Aliifodinibius sp. S!AR15-10]|uniref:sulfatase-like hydrolase/transferase n=1 Tax=Aliifodinibius sp. S!AR15-10 TaxID=2950437 RepID=UPI00285CDA89|nr:sulfatase-like hydrolase/transferase [Aliifodinibius sp. S!AR15-10]MDR8394633.1 sulfatase-like hydrolase/transferase [Aliifodinibius sp. S!AR15-10]
MLRYLPIKIILLGCLAVSACSSEKPQPNIVFIFADDLSYHDVGIYGNDEVRTPNIDALAKEGVKFTRAYNMGSWSPAVCIPSRTMLNIGQYVWNAQDAYENDYKQIHREGDFWSQKLKEAGYETYFTGKWHVPGLDPNELFDHVVHVRPGMPDQTEAGYDRPHEGKEDPWSPYDRSFGGFWEGGTHWSEVLTNDAFGFIDDASQRENPFFMYLAFNASHDPRQSPKEFVESYDPKELQIPENYMAEYPYNEAIGSGRELRDERLAPFPRTEYAVRVNRQEYYAIISHMDEQIGIIIDKLEASGKLENTILVFTADHGLAVGQHGLMGKQNMYEHSLRVPFVIAGPGIPSGERNETSIYLQDVVPTTIELAGGKIPDSYQFRSLLPLIHGEEKELHPAIYGAYLDKQRSVIEWPYKLILYPDISRVRLYNLEEDPYETKDLAELEDSGPIVKRLVNRLSELQAETGDKLDIEKFFGEWF